MDALEKATDTRIYDCPECGEDKVDQEEVIYEEAGKKLQQINVQVQSSPKRRKRATVSALGNLILKFIYSEKATKFCKIFFLLLTTVHTVKSKGKISQNFVAFSEYMNFTLKIKHFHYFSVFEPIPISWSTVLHCGQFNKFEI